MTEREHLLGALDSLENRQHAIHEQRRNLEAEESDLLQRKQALYQEIGALAVPTRFAFGSEGEYL